MLSIQHQQRARWQGPLPRLLPLPMLLLLLLLLLLVALRVRAFEA